MIASSKYLGVLLSTLGSLNDWIPVDLHPDILVQLASIAADGINGFIGVNGAGVASKCTVTGSSATPHTLPVYHAINPNAVDWATLVPAVAKYLGPSIKIVSWAEWVDALRDTRGSATTALSLNQNPALKLFDFFDSVAKAAEKGEEWPSLETKETPKKSPTLAELKPVSEQWMELWLKQWKF